jgi:hypothetical protein
LIPGQVQKNRTKETRLKAPLEFFRGTLGQINV